MNRYEYYPSEERRLFSVKSLRLTNKWWRPQNEGCRFISSHSLCYQEYFVQLLRDYNRWLLFPNCWCTFFKVSFSTWLNIQSMWMEIGLWSVEVVRVGFTISIFLSYHIEMTLCFTSTESINSTHRIAASILLRLQHILYQGQPYNLHYIVTPRAPTQNLTSLHSPTHQPKYLLAYPQY